MSSSINTGNNHKSISEYKIEQFFLSEQVTACSIILAVAAAFISGAFNAKYFTLVSLVFFLYFLIEAIVKIKVYTWGKYIISSGNKFDFTILLISAVLLFLPAFDESGVIYFRIFRVFTLFRVVHLIPNAEHIIRGLARAMTASKAVLVLLATMLIFFSMLGFSLFSNYLPDFFGNPLTSLNTTFQIFTIENWGAASEAAKALNDKYIYYAINSFVITVLILGGFIALSLANAVFIDEMVSDNNDAIRDELRKLKEENQEIKRLLTELVNRK